MTIQELFHLCSSFVTLYPEGTCKLPMGYPIAGRGFFPVVSGSFHSGSLTTQLKSRKLLFVGQDWGCEDNLVPLTGDKDNDIKVGTGKILLELLTKAKIPFQECFFTNALFGVRSGETNTGRAPGWNHPKFIGQCVKALLAQIDTLRPSGIVCLGLHAPALLSLLMPECEAWNSAGSYKTIDEAGCGVLDIQSRPGVKVAAILLHPSFRRPNAKHRNYGGENGHKAELKILADVWSQVSAKRK
jgi:uracil-DNA glycosylase